MNKIENRNHVGIGSGHPAIQQWRDALGSEQVLFSDTIREHFSRTATTRGTRPLGVLQPNSTEQVQQVVRIAAQHQIPIYPISCGKNWGYGSACAVTEGQVIVDLSRMNRIVEVNEELAYSVIEAGVTQQQLHEYLSQHRLKLLFDATAAGPNASIVGNILERGFGHSPYGDRFAHTCGLEIVLADGQVLNTGFGAYDSAKAARVYRPGLGPWLDSLFTQSNFSIVTRIGLWLMPLPESVVVFGFSVPDHDQLGEIAERLRKLRLKDVVRSHVHIANDLKVLSSRMPLSDLTDQTPLPDSLRLSLGTHTMFPKQNVVGALIRRMMTWMNLPKLGAWNLVGALYGTPETTAACRRVVRREFRGLAHVQFVDERKMDRLKILAAFLNRRGWGHQFCKSLDTVSELYKLLNGVPSGGFLRGLAWRRNPDTPKEFDPDNFDPSDYGCMWLSPVLPMTGEACDKLLELVEPILQGHKFDPILAFTAVNQRALCCTIQISFDKEDEGECIRAEQCYDQLFHLLFQEGYIPYRVGIQSMHKLDPDSSVFWEVVRNLKGALDPDGIIAPGRYQPDRNI